MHNLSTDWISNPSFRPSDDIKAGEFLLEYCGDLVSSEDADCRDDQTYIYYFTVGSKHYRFVNF